MGKQRKQWETLFFGAPKSLHGDCSHEIKRCLLLGRKVMTNLDSIFKSRDITLPTKVHHSQGYGFSCGHVWMWELDCEESWAPKSWCFFFLTGYSFIVRKCSWYKSEIVTECVTHLFATAGTEVSHTNLYYLPSASCVFIPFTNHHLWWLSLPLATK